MILGWISIWASLSFNPFKINQFIDYINFENITKTDLFELVDISRGLFQILYMIPLLVVFFSLFEVKKVFSKSNIIFFLFSILFLIETVSLLKTENLNMNIFFIICSFNTILTLFLLKNFFSEEDIILMFKLSIIFLFILIIFFGAQYILVAYKNGINVYSSWGNVQENLGLNVPRPTGLSRTALIVFIFFSNINFFRKPFDKINYLIMTYSIILLLLLSSRTITFLYILYVLFYIFYFKIFKFQKLFKLLKKFIFIPFVLILIIGILQNINIYNKKIDPSLTLDKVFSFETKNTLRIYPGSENARDAEFSSGRISDWKSILSLNQKKFFGNGVLGDRYLIDTSASNLLLYTYASSGIIGLFIIIFISLIILSNVLKEVFEKKSKFDAYRFVSSIILIGLMMRSILETSYGVFGIDFIIFCTCSFLIIPNNSYEPN